MTPDGHEYIAEAMHPHYAAERDLVDDCCPVHTTTLRNSKGVHAMNAITVISDEIVRNTVVRIERGQAAPDELTAITAVLLARATAYTDTPPAKHGRSKAGWRTPDHQAPNSWQS